MQIPFRPTTSLPDEPSSSPQTNIIGGKPSQPYRFTVLTPGILRIEYASDHIFEDRLSSFALHRNNLPTSSYHVKESSSSLEITTSYFHLTYNKQAFAPHGLYATSGRETWRWGDGNGSNLGGTIRTLDTMDGQRLMWSGTHVPHEDGVLGKIYAFRFGNLLHHLPSSWRWPSGLLPLCLRS